MSIHTRALIEDGIVVNVVVADGGYQEGVHCTPDVGIGWTYADGVFSPPLPPAPDPLTVDDFQQAIQFHVDQAARSRSYSDGHSLAGYVNSTVAAWAAEATAFVSWRDAVWLYAYAELDKVTNGLREAPTIDGFIAELPPIEWPS